MDTEPGVKRIMQRVTDPADEGRYYWNDPRVFGTRLLVLSNYDLATGEEYKNRYEIHGTYARYSVGRNFSHGCVRIPLDIAAFFHNLLPTTGTPVYIRD